MYLVIDIGGTYTKYGYYDKDGVCELADKIETVKTSKEDFYQSLLSLITSNTTAIAMSMPGLLDSQTGDIYAISLLPFLAGHNIIKDLKEYTHLPITVENDAKCATLGEMWKGNLQSVNNGLLMVLGSGIGGTIILDGKILKSPHHKAGEIGSILMNEDLNYKKMTNFGKNNSANRLIDLLSQVLKCENDGYLVFQKLQENQDAFNVFERYCREIAFMIYNLDYILDLDIVCIGGGISQQDILISTIQKQFTLLRNEYKEDLNEPHICSCAFFNEANLLGALYHHIYKPHQ